MPNPRTFFDISVGGQPASRLVFELFADECPKTSENFRALCTGERGLSKKAGVPLHYKNSTIHRAIAGFVIQGGDFTKHSGSGGESIYGAQFEDESFERKIDAPGLLVMANRGKDTNGSQFFITVAPSPHLNGKHVCFGRVVSGLDTAIAISELQTNERDRPLQEVKIVHCGELEMRKVVRQPRSPSPTPSGSGSESADSIEREREERKKRRREEKDERRAAKAERKAERQKKRLRLKSGSPPAPDADREAEEAAAQAAREEAERREAAEDPKWKAMEREAKRRQVEELRAQLDRERERNRRRGQDGDVTFKGRGSMALDDRSGRASGLRGW